jgi:hypothetical protein
MNAVVFKATPVHIITCCRPDVTGTPMLEQAALSCLSVTNVCYTPDVGLRKDRKLFPVCSHPRFWHGDRS